MRRAVLPAPDLDARLSPTREQVSVLQIDGVDDATVMVVGELDRAGARILAENLANVGAPDIAVVERHVELEQLDVAIEHDDHELAELALVFAGDDPVVVDAAVDGLLADQRPAA